MCSSDLAGECVVLELTARALRDVALVNPHVLQSIGRVVADRRADLERKRADAAKSMFETEDASRSLLDRIQNFLGLPGLFRT